MPYDWCESPEMETVVTVTVTARNDGHPRSDDLRVRTIAVRRPVTVMTASDDFAAHQLQGLIITTSDLKKAGGRKTR